MGRTRVVPFAFFGAGEAGYYESASLTVVFRKPPTSPQRVRLVTSIPAPLEPARWVRRTLLAATDDHAMTGTRNTRRFNAAIERWLHKCHAILPIDFVLRAEDDEGGGTTLSQWHHDSMAGALELVTRLDERYDDAETRDHVKATLLDMMRDAGITVPESTETEPEAEPSDEPRTYHFVAALLAGDAAVVDRFIELAVTQPFWSTMCAAESARHVEQVPDRAFDVLDRLIELANAHPVVVENALWAAQKFAWQVAHPRLKRYWDIAVAKLAEHAELHPYLVELGRVLDREVPARPRARGSRR